MIALVMLPYCSSRAEHDLEFVAEHLPEVAMDNRYATLPIWSDSLDASAWDGVLQGAFSSIAVGSLSLEGPMLSLALQSESFGPWQTGAFGFYDELSLLLTTKFQIALYYSPSRLPDRIDAPEPASASTSD